MFRPWDIWYIHTYSMYTCAIVYNHNSIFFILFVWQSLSLYKVHRFFVYVTMTCNFTPNDVFFLFRRSTCILLVLISVLINWTTINKEYIQCYTDKNWFGTVYAFNMICTVSPFIERKRPIKVWLQGLIGFIPLKCYNFAQYNTKFIFI